MPPVSPSPIAQPAERSWLARYSLAVGCAVAGLLVSLVSVPVLHSSTVFLAMVVIAAWFGGPGPGLLTALLATWAVEYFFTAPLHSFEPTLQQIPRLAVFAVLAVLGGWASAARKRAEDSLQRARDEMEDTVHARTAELRQSNHQLQGEIAERRRIEEALRERASLLDLTHDTVIVCDTHDVITLWNRGAEEQYGWTREEALGQVSHHLLQTAFGVPLAEIEAELARTGRWEGELVHARRDGSQIVVASRWALQSDEGGRAIAVLETNNDITGQKHSQRILEDLAGRLIDAQEQERSRIGRELHDHVSQMLGVLTIRIDQLRASTPTAASLDQALADLRRHTSDLTVDVHRLSHRLHSSTLDYLGLVPALQNLVAEFSERHGIDVSFADATLPAPLPPDVALCLFRVVEESLTNIAKHSGARAADVRLTGETDGVHLTVRDAGTGFDASRLERRAGLGFVSMQERLRVLHGTIRVDSAPERGTRIDAWVPSESLRSGERTGGERADQPLQSEPPIAQDASR